MSKHLLTIWDGLYQKQVGAKYPVNGGKDGKLLKDLRAIYSDEDITRFMTAFFEMEDDFFAQTGWSLGCFVRCLPKVLAFANRKPRIRQEWWQQHCRHTPMCTNYDDCRLMACEHEPRCEDLNRCRELRHKAS